MLELTVGDRVRSREGITGTVMRREHDFEHPRYVIDWDDGRAKRDLAERGPRFGRTLTAGAGGQWLKIIRPALVPCEL